ncbi:MAG TPA: N-acetyltransferase [Crocinitomix sp.]|nr:N-acetyltransferase [Crocinitomix sp.]
MIYRGKHIYLRTITPDDFNLIKQWENNPGNWKVSSTTHPFTDEQIFDFVNSNQDIYEHEQLRLIICLTDNNKVIGNVDLFNFEPLHKRVGIGILIDEPHRNKGYAKQAILLTEEYCKLILNINKIFCNILEDNTYSIKLFTTLGYKKICTKPKWHFYNNQWFDEGFYLKRF